LPAAFGHDALRHAKEGGNDELWLICEKLKMAVKKGDATSFTCRGIPLAENCHNARHGAGLIEEGEITHVASRILWKSCCSPNTQIMSNAVLNSQS
jgi:hypothetical protein